MKTNSYSTTGDGRGNREYTGLLQSNSAPIGISDSEVAIGPEPGRFAFHTMTSLSAPAEAKKLPLGEKVHPLTPPE